MSGTSVFSLATPLTNFTSAIREVPDHQEVYLDTNGLTSVIFDILEGVTSEEASTNEDALKFHFNDIVSGTTDTTKIWHGGSAVLSKMR
jgi:hypothetical protein